MKKARKNKKNPDTKIVHGATIQEYRERIVTGEFDGLKREAVVKLCGVERSTLWRWDKALDWDNIRDEKRKLFARHTVEVDAAVFKKAKGGNTESAKLYYQRFDGWVPESKQTQKVEGDDISDKDIDAEIRQLASTRQGQDTETPGSEAVQGTA